MKKILMSIMMVLVASSVAIGAAGAYFSSSAASNSNTLTSGTMALLLSDDNEFGQVSISDSWEGLLLKPGDTIPQSVITVRNDGTVDGNHLDLVVTLSPIGSNLADYIFFKQADGDNGLRFGASSSLSDSMNMVSYLLGTGSNDGDYDLYDGDDGTTSLYGVLSGNTEVSLQDLADLGRIRIVADSNSEGITASTQAYLWINATVGTGLTVQGETVDATLDWTLDQDASQM